MILYYHRRRYRCYYDAVRYNVYCNAWHGSIGFFSTPNKKKWRRKSEQRNAAGTQSLWAREKVNYNGNYRFARVRRRTRHGFSYSGPFAWDGKRKKEKPGFVTVQTECFARGRRCTGVCTPCIAQIRKRCAAPPLAVSASISNA